MITSYRGDTIIIQNVILIQGFTVDIYVHDEEEGEEGSSHGKKPTATAGTGSSSTAETPPTLTHIGRTSILPQQYLVPDKSQGKIVLTVFSPELLSIGTMTCKLS